MRTVIVGDIHGELDALNGLLEYTGTKVNLISLGDVIDRGPDSAGVVRRLRELGAALIRGNHEETMLRQYESTGRLRYDLSPEDLQYLQEAEDFMILRFPGIRDDIVVLHAGVTAPHRMPADILQDPESKRYKEIRNDLIYSYQLYPRDETIINIVAKLDGVVVPEDTLTISKYTVNSVKHRRCGDFVPLSRQKPGYPYWYDLYDGRFGIIIYGHIAHEEPHLVNKTIGIDTGAGLPDRTPDNQSLSAVIIEDDGEMSIVSYYYHKNRYMLTPVNPNFL